MRKNASSILRVVIGIAAGLFAQACATPYQRTGFAGGFSETQLAPDVFRVSFNGNGYTSGDRAADFALLRGAELCAQQGFPYMTLLDSKSDTRTETYVTPQQAQTYGTVNTYGRTATYTGTTTYTGGQVMTFYKPGVGLIVRGMRERPADTFAFDTQFLIETLRSKYGIGGEPVNVRMVAVSTQYNSEATGASLAADARVEPTGPSKATSEFTGLSRTADTELPPGQFHLTFDQAWARALQTLALDGAQITLSDKSSGVIQFAGSYAGKSNLYSCPRTSGVLTEQKFSGTVVIKPAGSGTSAVTIQTTGVETRYLNRHLLMFKTGKVDHATPCQSTGVLEQAFVQRLSTT